MPPSICLSARGHARIASAVRFCLQALRKNARIKNWLGGRESAVRLFDPFRPIAVRGQLIPTLKLSATRPFPLFASDCRHLQILRARCHLQ
jgi:hypothetical protein